MKSKFLVPLGIFLLLGGLLASELGLYFLTEHIPIVSPSYRGWAEPDFYRLSRADSNTAHRWILFLKADGIVCLAGLLLISVTPKGSSVSGGDHAG